MVSNSDVKKITLFSITFQNTGCSSNIKNFHVPRQIGYGFDDGGGGDHIIKVTMWLTILSTNQRPVVVDPLEEIEPPIHQLGNTNIVSPLTLQLWWVLLVPAANNVYILYVYYDAELLLWFSFVSRMSMSNKECCQRETKDVVGSPFFTRNFEVEHVLLFFFYCFSAHVIPSLSEITGVYDCSWFCEHFQMILCNKWFKHVLRFSFDSLTCCVFLVFLICSGQASLHLMALILTLSFSSVFFLLKK